MMITEINLLETILKKGHTINIRAEKLIQFSSFFEEMWTPDRFSYTLNIDGLDVAKGRNLSDCISELIVTKINEKILSEKKNKDKKASPVVTLDQFKELRCVLSLETYEALYGKNPNIKKVNAIHFFRPGLFFKEVYEDGGYYFTTTVEKDVITEENIHKMIERFYSALVKHNLINKLIEK